MSDIATLSAVTAHNAVGSLVQLYTGILSDHARELQMAQQRLDALTAHYEAAITDLTRERDALRRQLGQEPGNGAPSQR